MATLCLCRDVPGSAPLRAASRDAHFAYIETIMDRLLIAGPVQPTDETVAGTGDAAWRGSVFLYATDDEDEALALLHADPYYRAGIYGSVETRPFLPAAGRWIGGGIWQASVPKGPGEAR